MVLKEAESLYEGRGRLRLAYERLAQRLDTLGIESALVGAYALIIHGVRRFTEDIDLLLRPHDAETLRDRLVGQGYTTIKGSTRSIRDAETGVRIDLVLSGDFPGDGRPKPIAFPDPAEHLQPDTDIRVVDLRTLIELKLASGMTAPDRLQDLADVQRLIRTRHLDRTFANELHAYVRDEFLRLLETVGGEPDSP